MVFTFGGSQSIFRTMRFLLYNIRYGTGGKRFLLPWSGYLRRTSANTRNIINFIKSFDPDIVGLVEVDTGSYRSGRQNQAEVIADALGHYNTHKSKYGDFSLVHLLPVMNKQGNAFLTRQNMNHVQFHYFDKGVKRLVIELELQDLTLFLVHLAISYKARHHQLSDLYSLVKGTSRPHVVAGDFNASWGDKEIRLFLAATGLAKAGPSSALSYPSWAPKRELDFILHSPDIKVTDFMMPKVTYSDHLPLVCDLEIG